MRYSALPYAVNMILMTISDARASLAEVIDQVRITNEPVLARHSNTSPAS